MRKRGLGASAKPLHIGLRPTLPSIVRTRGQKWSLTPMTMASCVSIEITPRHDQNSHLYLPPDRVEGAAAHFGLKDVCSVARLQEPRDLKVRVARCQVLLVHLAVSTFCRDTTATPPPVKQSARADGIQGLESSVLFYFIAIRSRPQCARRALCLSCNFVRFASRLSMPIAVPKTWKYNTKNHVFVLNSIR